MLFRQNLFLLITGISAASLPACSASNQAPEHSPADASADDTEGGSGGSAGATPAGCQASEVRCSNTFTYPFAGETSVELRGDWDGQVSWDKGIPLTITEGKWTGSVLLPLSKKVEYKFCTKPNALALKGCDEWKVDPSQPLSDGGNNTLTGVAECSDPICDNIPSDVFDWRDAVVYFPMVDRFVDGDGKNECRVADAKVADLANFKGGDWLGITQKINEGYFYRLGVNTLWLTVPAENAVGPDEGVGENKGKWFTGYHGYWPKELAPSAPNHCFGSPDDLRNLINTAHVNDMKVVADFVMVHLHTTSSIYASHPEWFFGDKTQVCSGDQWEVFDKDQSGNCVKWNAELPGNRCWFSPMLAHWNYTLAEAREYSINNVMSWIKTYNFDGLRLNAVKHADQSWLLQLRSTIRQQLPLQKGERFLLMGETADGNSTCLKIHVNPYTMLDGQFDYATKYAIVDSILKKTRPMTALRDAVLLSETAYGPNAIMGTFFGSIDEARPVGLAGEASSLPAYERLANAFAVLMTVRGAPSILYGDEIGLPGTADPENRPLMLFNGLSEGQTALKSRVERLGLIRREHVALRKGKRQDLLVNEDLWFFKSFYGSDLVFVAINRADNDTTVDGIPSSSKELLTETDVDGPIAKIPARQARIFVPR